MAPLETGLLTPVSKEYKVLGRLTVDCAYHVTGAREDLVLEHKHLQPHANSMLI